jgi:hypothetical protein
MYEESPYKPDIGNSRSKTAICPQLCPQFIINEYKQAQINYHDLIARNVNNS